MDRKNEKAVMTELTPDQMDKVTGGAGGFPAPSDPFARGSDSTGSVSGYGKCPP